MCIMHGHNGHRQWGCASSGPQIRLAVQVPTGLMHVCASTLLLWPAQD